MRRWSVVLVAVLVTLAACGAPGVGDKYFPNYGNGGYNVTYYNQGVQEEVSVQSKALPAETGGGGIYVNIITKDGGNKFKGSLFSSYTGKSL